MSLLSFRIPHALKLLNPNHQTYVFFDANLYSYRQIYELPHFPKLRSNLSKAFVKHILQTIYGLERAQKFDGENHFYLETKSSTTENPPNPESYDLPWLIDYFVQITEQKGGVPVIFPVTQFTLQYFVKGIAEKLSTDFLDHTIQLGRLLFNPNMTLKDLQEDSRNDLLWPDLINPSLNRKLA